jgi:hypothetical protein
MLTWASISTIATIAALAFGIVRWVQARRKAAVDRLLGEAKAKSETLAAGVEAAKERTKTDAAIINLRDDDTDARLDKWMRD